MIYKKKNVLEQLKEAHSDVLYELIFRSFLVVNSVVRDIRSSVVRDFKIVSRKKFCLV